MAMDLQKVNERLAETKERYQIIIEDQLARAGLFSFAPAMRRVDEAFAAVIDGPCNLAGRGGIIASNVAGDAVKIFGSGSRLSQAH